MSYFLQPIFDSAYSICASYNYLDFGGGIYITMPFGLCIGIMNNLGALLVINLISKIKFHSIQS
jgi:hypothetical protein